MKDGGRAFPGKGMVSETVRGTTYHWEVDLTGMSLRDWFAGQVLSALAAKDFDGNWQINVGPEQVAKDCFAYADAMIAARTATHGEEPR